MTQSSGGRTPRCRLGRAALGLAMALALAGSALAATPTWEAGLQENAPSRYTVVRGDTLWDIAGRFLRHPWQWPAVWQVNPQIENPHLIYPGDVVFLYDCDGRPCLGLERGQGVVRLSPEMRTLPHREAIDPIPLESIHQFLRDYRVVDDREALDAGAYVVGADDRRLISGAGDRLYARGGVEGGGRLGLYRVGEHHRDPRTGELLGIELEGVGEARHRRSDDEFVTLEVTASRQEVRNGDLVLPLERRQLTTRFLPRAPEADVDGHIMAVPGGVRFIGRLQVVALDRGLRDGLAPGHVLRVEQRGELVSDPRTEEVLRLPGEQAGLVMVFRPYEKMSYALVMQASRPLAVGDRVHTPSPAMTTARR